MLAQVMTRMWQLSSAMTWYKRHAEMVPADVVDYTTPHPEEVVDAPLPSSGGVLEVARSQAPDAPASGGGIPGGIASGETIPGGYATPSSSNTVAQNPSSPPTTDRRPDIDAELPPADA